MRKNESKKMRIYLRVDEIEMEKIHAMMDTYGYPSKSSFLRALLFQKRLSLQSKKERNFDSELRKRINQMIFQINKIGNNYNQIVTTYQRQAKQIKPDGNPAYNSRNFENKIDELKILTEKVRDEVISLKAYFDEAQE